MRCIILQSFVSNPLRAFISAMLISGHLAASLRDQKPRTEPFWMAFGRFQKCCNLFSPSQDSICPGYPGQVSFVGFRLAWTSLCRSLHHTVWDHWSYDQHIQPMLSTCSKFFHRFLGIFTEKDLLSELFFFQLRVTVRLLIET